MAHRVRTRKRNLHFVGSVTPHDGVPETTSYSGFESAYCDDSTSKPPHVRLQNFLQVNRRELPPAVTGSHVWAYENPRIAISNYPVDAPPIIDTLDSLEPDAKYITDILARENTNNGEINLATSVAELYQLSDMVRSIHSLGSRALKGIKEGGSRSSDPSDAYLLNEFGLAPMFGDMLAVMDLQKSVARRFRRINKMSRGESVGGTLVRYHHNRRRDVIDTLPYGVGMVLTGTSEIEYNVWYTLHSSPFRRVPPSFMNFARAAGLNRPDVTAWNLIPWSFLYDYFIDVGSYLESIRNDFPSISICLMRHRKIETTYKVKSNFSTSVFSRDFDYSVTSRPSFYETKARKVFHNPKGSVTFTPWLSPGQVNNIAALLGKRR